MAWRFLAAVMAALASGSLAAGEIPSQDKKSGSEFMAPATRTMQEDDLSNPGMLFIGEGEQLWQRREGEAAIACAQCHGAASRSMRGAALHYPAIDRQTGGLIDLQGKINQCRQTRQAAPPLPYESAELLALTAYVAHQSRGMMIVPLQDERLAPHRENGRRLFERRLGQLGLSCAACHDERWGKRLAGSVIPQGHPTAYPLYRLEWQALGSLQRRLRNCMIGMRAEPYPYGAQEFIALELYLMSRATGLAIETPGVRP